VFNPKGAVMEINDISKMFEDEKEKYIKDKIDEYMKKGETRQSAANKASQSWRTYIGSKIQSSIRDVVETLLKNLNVKITSDKELTADKLPLELEKVKRKLVVNYGEYLFLPDADIVIYRNCNDDVKILAIISVKNSFRERGFETTYWKLKLKESPITSQIKVFLATPDKDNEISYITPNKKPKKMRVILEYELDGLYFIRKDFEKTDKAKHLEELTEDIAELLKKNC